MLASKLLDAGRFPNWGGAAVAFLLASGDILIGFLKDMDLLNSADNLLSGGRAAGTARKLMGLSESANILCANMTNMKINQIRFKNDFKN